MILGTAHESEAAVPLAPEQIGNLGCGGAIVDQHRGRALRRGERRNADIADAARLEQGHHVGIVGQRGGQDKSVGPAVAQDPLDVFGRFSPSQRVERFDLEMIAVFPAGAVGTGNDLHRVVGAGVVEKQPDGEATRPGQRPRRGIGDVAEPRDGHFDLRPEARGNVWFVVDDPADALERYSGLASNVVHRCARRAHSFALQVHRTHLAD